MDERTIARPNDPRGVCALCGCLVFPGKACVAAADGTYHHLGCAQRRIDADQDALWRRHRPTPLTRVTLLTAFMCGAATAMLAVSVALAWPEPRRDIKPANVAPVGSVSEHAPGRIVVTEVPWEAQEPVAWAHACRCERGHVHGMGRPLPAGMDIWCNTCSREDGVLSLLSDCDPALVDLPDWADEDSIPSAVR